MIKAAQVEEAVLNSELAKLSLYKLLEMVDNDKEAYPLIMHIAGAVAEQVRKDSRLIDNEQKGYL